MITLNINGQSREVAADPDTPLLWALRDDLQMTGTKFGCGRAFCGACTVHIGGEAARSCSILVGNVDGKTITTIEGLSGDVAEAVKNAWIEAQVPQCGYCQPGFVMAVTSVLRKSKGSEENQRAEEVLSQITNICRCGTYDAIRTAVGIALRTLAAPRGDAPRRESSP
jgi:isoquinoline 1-oxidoreductase alpha subunit